MPVLIDGDNLLHAVRGRLADAEQANRASLCKLLASWDRSGRRRITIYFDGVRPDNVGDGSLGVGRLTIRYSNRETADARIIEEIQASSHPRRLLVVSSDREIRAAARRRRAPSMSAPDFVDEVVDDLHREAKRRPREPREKFHGLEPGQTDYWLEQLGLRDEPSDDEYGLLQ